MRQKDDLNFAHLLNRLRLNEMTLEDGDLNFAHLLNRLRLNEMTKEDKTKLQTCIVDLDTGDYPKDALHLFAENLFMNKHNDKILSQMPGEKVVIPCHDNVVSASILA